MTEVPSTTRTMLGEEDDSQPPAVSIVDCDVHPIFAKPWKEALAPYMPPTSRERPLSTR